MYKFFKFFLKKFPPQNSKTLKKISHKNMIKNIGPKEKHI